MKNSPLRQKQTKKCSYCRKEFKIFSSFDKFCCKSHGNLYKNSKKIFDKDLEWIEVRKEILKRDSNRCVLTGVEFGLEVHHIVPRSIADKSFKNKPLNLITVNNFVHNLFHNDLKNSIPIVQYLLTNIYGYNYGFLDNKAYSVDEDVIRRVLSWNSVTHSHIELLWDVNVKIIYFLINDKKFKDLEILKPYRNSGFVEKNKLLLKDYL